MGYFSFISTGTCAFKAWNELPLLFLIIHGRNSPLPSHLNSIQIHLQGLGLVWKDFGNYVSESISEVWGRFLCCFAASKWDVLVHLNPTLVKWYSHSVAPRALTRLWKQSNLRAWSGWLWSWHLTNTHIWGRLWVLFVCSPPSQSRGWRPRGQGFVQRFCAKERSISLIERIRLRSSRFPHEASCEVRKGRFTPHTRFLCTAGKIFADESCAAGKIFLDKSWWVVCLFDVICDF